MKHAIMTSQMKNNMGVSLLELRRARRALDEFCARRNRLMAGSGMRLSCKQQHGSLVIGETSHTGSKEGSRCFHGLVRLSLENDRWLLYWPQGGSWEPYPHMPEVQSVQSVIDELERAPLHVHWD